MGHTGMHRWPNRARTKGAATQLKDASETIQAEQESYLCRRVGERERKQGVGEGARVGLPWLQQQKQDTNPWESWALRKWRVCQKTGRL